MWDFRYQFSKQNKSDLKFDDRFLSDTFYVRAYNLKTKAKFQNATHGLGEEPSQMTCAKFQVCCDEFPAQSVRLKTAKSLKNKYSEIKL